MPSYMGGKHKLAKHLVGAIALEVGSVECWVEPFVGGGSVAAAAVQRFGCDLVLSDIDPHAAVLWDRSTGFDWPDDAVFTEDDWTRLREAGEVDKLTALAAFGASFGGKKWGGFARPDLRVSRPCSFGMAVRSWRRKFDAMSAASLVTSECLPYWRVDPPAGSVVATHRMRGRPGTLPASLTMPSFTLGVRLKLCPCLCLSSPLPIIGGRCLRKNRLDRCVAVTAVKCRRSCSGWWPDVRA